MATPETTETLKGALATVTGFDGPTLVSRTEWGAINFEDVKHDIELALYLATGMADMPIELLPEQAAKQIAGAIPAVASALKAIDGFKILDAGNVASARDTAASRMKASTDQLLVQAGPWLPYLAYQKGDIIENMDRMRATVAEMETIRGEAKAMATEQKAEMDEIMSAAREAAADAGVATFTHAFRDQADDVLAHSQRWLWAAAVGAVLTISWVLLAHWWPETAPSSDAWVSIRLLFTKFSVAAVLLTATVWCARIYRAMRHQETINRHRALGLQTFQAFTSASSNEETKDAVLVAATHSIFDNVPTGLADERSRSSMRIMEMAAKSVPKMPTGDKG